jgi:hypothetical protein
MLVSGYVNGLCAEGEGNGGLVALRCVGSSARARRRATTWPRDILAERASESE